MTLRLTCAALVLSLFLLSGCSASDEAAEKNFSGTMFGYKISDCDCAVYAVKDPLQEVSYTFRAEYRMERGVVTEIGVMITNDAPDTVYLGSGSVMVSSRNIKYQYNDRFVPLPDLVILPGNVEELNISGVEVTETPNWRRIAGEQLTLTLSRIQIGEKILADQVVTFIPENPLLFEDREDK